MADFDVREKRFEQDIETFLCTQGGYLKGDPAAFDRKLALDTATLLSFIKNSQPREWKRYVRIYGADSERRLIERFCRETDTEGLLAVFRKGFIDQGVRFRAVFWKPETSMNEATRKAYESNILHCTRQLHYATGNEKSIDIVLFVNGIPVVSMELKCEFTGQNTANAIEQYRFDRQDRDTIFAFKKRVLVHFAVDLENVYMTTRLQGERTFFLPFNQGSNGAGHVGGKGNPPNPDGYQTAYLWEQVLFRDRLLEILQKYIHIEKDKNGIRDDVVIFPRYHQLDVVTRLLAHVRENGAGHHYLIQHSAGSGKSNSIAWLAHRLSGLHDDRDEKIFHSVIVVTDRRILDNQLQETVYQFDHVEGVVQKIDEDSRQLKEAIESATPIIITTLQKFPVIYREVNSGKRRYAVIVDEAHSSQTGDAARKLKQALSDRTKALEEYAELEELTEAAGKDDEDKMLDEMAAHGRHDNLSFFAFTATPKARTLQMFGNKAEDGRYRPFHIYSMRQAIEEGFILDVLAHYMTYRMYYRIVKAIPDDPELDTSAGVRAIRRFETLRPHNISAKTSVMLEHFLHTTQHKIGGRAKAMVVTPSRLHAVRYVLEFRRQLQEKGFSGTGVLVAFSGEVDDDGVTYTEEKMNRTAAGETIRESQLRETFAKDEYKILIVAEKYQTGFDQPLLHTMFVDKKLSDVKAVQTLSRLNRTARGKVDTFVLDFVNTAEDIRNAFEPYYEETVLEEETDPNVIYDLKNTLEHYRLWQKTDIDRFAALFWSTSIQQAGDMGKLMATLRPALDRFDTLQDDEKDLFKSTLARFNRIYAFVTQICRLFDRDIHAFSQYARFLARLLPKDGRATVDVDDKVLLEYYRLEKQAEQRIVLTGNAQGFRPVTGDAGRREKKKDPLTVIIDRINEKHGTNFTEMDKVLLQLQNDYLSDSKWQGYAQNSDPKAFMTLFDSEFHDMVAARYEENNAFFNVLLNDPDMLRQTMQTIGAIVYRQLNAEKTANKS